MFTSATITAAVGIYVACDNRASNQSIFQEWSHWLMNFFFKKIAPTVLAVLRSIDFFEQSDKIQRVAESFAKPAVSWLLAMDALATLYYHLFKTVILGVVTQCFYNWSLTPQALWVRFTCQQCFEEWIQTNYRNMTVNQKELPMAPESELSWGLSIPLFIICFLISTMTSKWFYQTSESDGDEMSDTEMSDTGDETVRRSEFLYVGLGHWMLTFIRRKMEQQSMPHNFNFFGLPIGGDLTNNMIIEKFHNFLSDIWGLQMPTDGVTIFDQAYLAWDKFSAVMLCVEGWAMVMVVLATLLHKR
jgi:hypothetical protein